jgi:hypothetical protein
MPNGVNWKAFENFMTYRELDELMTGRTKDRRKLANNTYAERRSADRIAIRLHATDILLFDKSGRVMVTTGGWMTVTTKARLNEYLPGGYRIWSTRGVWYWHNGTADKRVYTDGDSILPNGKLNLLGTADDAKDARKLRAKIAKYAKLCADKVPMSPPSGGDCWGCYFKDENGKEAMGVDHLTSHMDEGYVVPSLVLSALKERGCTPFIQGAAFADPNTAPENVTMTAIGWAHDVARDHVKRAVAKYMHRRFGIA